MTIRDDYVETILNCSWADQNSATPSREVGN